MQIRGFPAFKEGALELSVFTVYQQHRTPEGVKPCVCLCVATEHSHLAMTGWGGAEKEQSSI